ncbi:hypothetical protein ANCCEY_04419 [Ancylostoma ceylanicum]|uniref:Uncharacterized protein n=1 Tax=Ancylostoma ceylanicum TaxID=53326 RepID=A0A0D6LXF8_9BILA|nr:hypothetical protein ANCCEY_04419 [Ancylostoma ceylanicum]
MAISVGFFFIFLLDIFIKRMSSTATQRSLLLALSGVSLAALFIWYLQSKKARRNPSIEDVKRNIKADAVDNSKQKGVNNQLGEALVALPGYHKGNPRPDYEEFFGNAIDFLFLLFFHVLLHGKLYWRDPRGCHFALRIKRNEIESEERSISTTRGQSLNKTENKVVEKSEEKEPSQKCALVSDTQLNAGPPKMTTALETGPVSQVDSSAIPIVNGIAKEAEEPVAEVKVGLLNAEATKEDQCQVKEEEQKQCQIEEQEQNREEQSVEEAAADLQQQLVLDVSHQAEPEAFSWSDEMERSYEESRKKEEEERQQQESGAVNGSGDYTTSDSPGLASQNSEHAMAGALDNVEIMTGGRKEEDTGISRIS